jgi:xanthine dehydrogenase accessory factor
LQILLEPVTERSQLSELLAAIEQRRRITRRLHIASGTVVLTPGHAAAAVNFDGADLITSHGPRFRLIIIGAAQVSRYLASMAQALDYHVIVCDPRKAYMEEWDVNGVELSTQMPDDLLMQLQLDECSAVVTLTHDPKLDDMALLEALRSPAFYVGAIGSRGNNRKRRERLALFDLDAAQIARLHGPVGLHIGARTPPEIALAVLAEMTALRNGVDVVQTHALREAEYEMPRLKSV